MKKSSDYQLLTENETRNRINAWNASETAGVITPCLSNLFERQVRKSPDKIAFHHGKETITYASLNARANKIARHLIAKGVKANIFVGVYQNNSIDAVIGILAILKAGAAFVPIDVSYPCARRDYMIKNAEIKLVLSTKKFIPAELSDIEYIDIHTVANDPQYSEQDVENHTTLNDFIYLLYTSGTTGTPKGAVIAHRGVSNLLDWYINYCSINTDDKILILSSFSFDLTYKNLFSGLLTSAQVHLVDIHPFDPDCIIKTIHHHKITFMNCTPSVFYALCEQANLMDMSSLRMVCLGGEAINAKRLQKFHECCPSTIIVNTYGPTECSDLACAYTLTHEDIRHSKLIPVGNVLPGVKILLLNANLEMISANEPGELYIGGIGIGVCYYNAPEETTKNFINNPFNKLSPELGLKIYKTGDRVQFLENGLLQYLGRIDDQIKLRGLRIEPLEIEKVIMDALIAEQVIVLCENKTDTNQTLVAYLVTKTKDIDVGRLKKKLASKLPEYMVPSKFYAIDSSPQTPNGKLDKKALSSYAREIIVSHDVIVPRTNEEQALLAIWADVLYRDAAEISVHDNFFELGGYSILVTQVNMRIKRIFDVNLPLERFFSKPTIFQLADVIAKALLQKNKQTAVADITRANEKQGELSFSQQRIWFLTKLLPESGFYNLPNAFWVKGCFDVNLIKKAMSILADEHAMLKTSFNDVNGIAYQMVHEGISYDDNIELIDLRMRELQHAKDVTIEEINRDANRPFDLTKPFLLRVKIFILSNAESAFYINFHHSILDGWSWNNFKRELSRIYNSLSTGKLVPPTKDSVQYLDFVRWQNTTYTPAFLQEAEDYWFTLLKGLEPNLLPTDFMRPSQPRFQGKRIRLKLPSLAYQNLEKIAQIHQTTFFTILITIFSITLYKFSSITKLAIATPVANRLHEKLENLLGHFINTVIFYAEIEAGSLLKEFLSANNNKNLKLLSYQYYPFEKLVDLLKLNRDINKNPISPVMFSFQNHQTDDFNLSGATLHPLEIQTHYSRFDIEWQVWLEGKDISLDIFYNTEIYKSSTIQNLVDQFTRLLEKLPEFLDKPLLDIYYEANQNLSIKEGLVKSTQGLSVYHYIEEHAFNTPQSLAIMCNDTQISFDDLNQFANQMAYFLIDHGITKGDRIAVILERSEKPLIIFIACMKLGAIFIPLAVNNPPDRLNTILSDVNPALTFIDQSTPDIQLANIITIDHQALSLSHYPAGNPTIHINDSDPAYIIYTSGSSGKPKGVVISHKSLLNVILSIADNIEFSRDSHWLAITTFAFDIALLELFTPLVMGGKLTIAPQQILSDIPDLISQIKLLKNLVIQATPTLWKILVNNGWSNGANTKIISGGETLSRSLATALLDTGAQVWNAYGPTETAIWSTLEPVSYYTETIPIGRPLFNTKCYVLNDDQVIVPIGQSGELYIAGDGVAISYWQLPELTADKFRDIILPNGKVERCFRTGDYVTLKSDGSFTFIGRMDSQVKINGYRIELAEIEHFLLAHPFVDQAAVIINTATEHQSLVAFVTVNAHANCQPLDEGITQNWKNIFDEFYLNEESHDKFSGWISSYTHQPIPHHEMEEWLLCSEKTIRKLNPASILEIGCGLGLLIPKLAPSCEYYIATDLSGTAVSRLQKNLALPNVRVVQCDARDAVDHIYPSINTIVLNSVFQYLPSLHYFESLIESMINKIADNSVIFIGDVRGHELARYFHASLLHHKKTLSLEQDEATQQIAGAIANDPELLVSPTYFLSLTEKFSAITYVEIQPKLGQDKNELNKYRFDVFIHIKSQKPVLRPTVILDAQTNILDFITIKNILENNVHQICHIKNISNKLLKTDLATFQWLSDRNSTPHNTYLAPYELEALADSHNLNIHFQLCLNTPGTYDVIFSPSDFTNNSSVFPYQDFTKNFLSHEPQHETSIPLQLSQYLATKLPFYMLPTEIIMIEKFALTPNGKIDKKSLASSAMNKTSKRRNVGNESIDLALAKFWSQTLGTKEINLDDNFFDIGGHSLLAIHLLAKCNNYFNVNVLLYDFYKNPTFQGHLELINGADNKNILLADMIKSVSIDKPTLFLIPPIDGSAEWYNDLTPRLEHVFNCFALKQPSNLNPDIFSSVEDIANYYVEEIRSIQATGPYHLLGWSFGGIIGFEMGHIFHSIDEVVKNLILVDTPVPQESNAVLTANNNVLSLQNSPSAAAHDDAARFIYQNSQAFIHYLPKACHLNTAIIIHANDKKNASTENSWEKMFNTDSLRIIDADHYSILKPPHVDAVGEYIINQMEDENETITSL